MVSKSCKKSTMILFTLIVIINFIFNNSISALVKIPQIGDKAPNILLYDLKKQLFNLRKLKLVRKLMKLSKLSVSYSSILRKKEKANNKKLGKRYRIPINGIQRS